MPCNLSYQSNFSSGADSEHLSIWQRQNSWDISI